MYFAYVTRCILYLLLDGRKKLCSMKRHVNCVLDITGKLGLSTHIAYSLTVSPQQMTGYM